MLPYPKRPNRFSELTVLIYILHFKEAAPLSAQLWMKFTPAKVILQIVYSEPEISKELLNYKKELEKYGTLVYLAPTGSDMKCVLKSQMIRLVAYSLPFIQDQDIIVTGIVFQTQTIFPQI